MELQDFPLVAVILAIAAVAGMLAARLRQPLIVAFIGVGILVGPTGTGWVVGESTIELLARLGIAVLLFLVGLRLDLHLIRTAGPIALTTGLIQIGVTALLGYLIAVALGMDAVTAVYIAMALTFSSTIIIVKLLSDKRELEQLHGRITVGILIVQDIVVVVAMIALTASGRAGGENVTLDILAVFAKGAALLAGIGLLMQYVLPWLLHHVARSQELLLLFGIAYAVSVAAVSEWLNFSTEVGAFLAGVSVASTPYRDALGARLVTLRDFLLLFFFLELGAQLRFHEAAEQLGAAVILAGFVFVVKPLLVFAIMALMRYPVRVDALTGLSLGQISEFSLILAALGLSLGHISNATVSLITVVGVVTIGGSTYVILYANQIYARIQGVLSHFDRTGGWTTPQSNPEQDVDVILYGLGRFGSHVADRLSSSGYRVLAVDFDPHQVSRNNRNGVTAMFGSAEDLHFLESLPLAHARYVISTVPDAQTNKALLHGLLHHNYKGRIALAALTRHDCEQLRGIGADLVVEPFAIAADGIVDGLDDPARRTRDETRGTESQD